MTAIVSVFDYSGRWSSPYKRDGYEVIQVDQKLGDDIRVTLFGESHGVAVGALLEGLPAGTPIDEFRLISDLERRRPGRRLL